MPDHPKYKRTTAAKTAITTASCVVLLAAALPALGADQATRTRIAICGTEGPAGARSAGESLLGAVIENTLGRIGAALRAAGEASTKSSVVHRNIEARPGETINCLQIARGQWGPKKSAWKDKLERMAFVGNVADPYLQAEPDFVLHLTLRASNDKTALELVPKSLEYGRHLTDTKSDARGLALEISFHGPGQPSDHKDAVGASLVLGDFKPGHRYDLVSGETEEWDRRNGGWKEVKGERHPAMQEESQWFPTYAPLPDSSKSSGASVNGAPKIVTVTVAETRKARPMLLFLADVFDASKSDVKASLENKLLKSKQEESQLAAAREKNDQYVGLITAVADAEVALAKYCEMGAGKQQSEYLQASKAVFVAMNSANFMAGNLGRPPAFAVVPSPSSAQAPQNLCQ